LDTIIGYLIWERIKKVFLESGVEDMDNLWVVAELFSELPCLSVGALVPWPDVVVKNRL
jgi:hypothetical protein